MAELIEDYGSPTKDLCVLCRSARTPRFYFMQEIVVADSTPTTHRELFRVCPFCDVDDDTKNARR